ERVAPVLDALDRAERDPPGLHGDAAGHELLPAHQGDARRRGGLGQPDRACHLDLLGPGRLAGDDGVAAGRPARTGGPGRAGVALGTVGAVGTGRAGVTLGAIGTGRALSALSALGTLRTLRTRSALRTLAALRTRSAGSALLTGSTRGARRAGSPL